MLFQQLGFGVEFYGVLMFLDIVVDCLFGADILASFNTAMIDENGQVRRTRAGSKWALVKSFVERIIFSSLLTGKTRVLFRQVVPDRWESNMTYLRTWFCIDFIST